MEKSISYLTRDFKDYKSSIMGFTKEYYPHIANDLTDASVGSWMVDMLADVADNLSYHIDRVYQETNINSAQKKSSLYALARNNGVKIPGPKGAIVELKFTCDLPISGSSGPNYKYAPVIKKGTKVSSGVQVFETVYDIDFSKQFNHEGVSDRTIVPIRNSNGVVVKYEISKYALAIAGETKIYSKYISSTDIVPFMEIVIPELGVMCVESILTKEGSYNSNPQINEFFKEAVDDKGVYDRWYDNSNRYTWRFHEVEYLAQQERWGDVVNNGEPETYTQTINDVEVVRCTRGEWKPLRQKFITEYTDKGYMKVIFGSYNENTVENGSNIDTSPNLSLISQLVNNKSMGVLPKAGHTMFILYRTGGGKTSNVAAGSVTTLIQLNATIPGATQNDTTAPAVRNSIRVTNTTPSVSGKDMPTENELRYLIKYAKAEQNRCVTLKDYVSRVLLMPSRYGTPFRVSAAEDNNKVLLYLLGVDHNGKLNSLLPEMLSNNIKNYLEEYRCLNDFVEIRSGKIINLSFEIDVYVDRNYESPAVISSIIDCVKDYMDINNHMMGDDVFVGDIQKEISKLDGVINLIEIRVYNETGDGYSSTKIGQPLKKYSECCNEAPEDRENRIDLVASEGILYSDGDTMLEVKYPDKDIRVRVKIR